MEKRIWFITGISSGLGKAMAATAMANGDFVVGTFRKTEQVEEFNNINGEKGCAFLLDVTNGQQVEEVIHQIEAKFGKIDVLVNNAGYGFIGSVEESTLEEVRAVMEANFFGALNITQTILPLMRKQKNGHIIQVSSQAGVKAAAGFGIYNASKFALEGFSEALAQEVAPLGIKVSIVEPGPFRTGFAGKGLVEAKNEIADYANTAGNFRAKLKTVDGKQEGHPEKAAEAIIDLVNADKPSLRLPLGKIAIASIQMKIDSLTTDLEANREIAERVVFD